MDPTKKPMGNAGAREEYALTASYKVTAVLLIYTVLYVLRYFMYH
jgi:hypothetical protein